MAGKRKALNTEKFIDKEILTIYQDFYEYLLQNYFNERSNALWRVYVKLGNEIAPLLNSNQLDSTHLLKLYDLPNEMIGNINFNRFLFYLIEKGKIKDPQLLRILHFKERLTKESNLFAKKTMNRILKCERFDDFSKMEGFGKDSRFNTLFFMEIDYLSAKDDLIGEMANHYLEELKFGHQKLDRKIDLCNSFRKAYELIFIDILMTEFNFEYLQKLIREKLESQRDQSCIFSQALFFIIYLSENGIKFSDEIQKLINLRKSFEKQGVRMETLLKIPNSNELKKYAALPVAKKGHSTLLYINISCKDVWSGWYEYSQISFNWRPEFQIVSEEFDISLKDHNLSNISDLNYLTFCAQIEYFKKYNNTRHLAVIVGFYLFLKKKLQ